MMARIPVFPVIADEKDGADAGMVLLFLTRRFVGRILHKRVTVSVYIAVIKAEAANVGDAANTDAANMVDLIGVAESFSDEEDVDVTDVVSVGVDIVDVIATDTDADTDVADAVLLDSASFLFRTLLL